MPCIEGESLREKPDREHPLPGDEAVDEPSADEERLLMIMRTWTVSGSGNGR